MVSFIASASTDGGAWRRRRRSSSAASIRDVRVCVSSRVRVCIKHIYRSNKSLHFITALVFFLVVVACLVSTIRFVVTGRSACTHTAGEKRRGESERETLKV